MQAVSDFRVAIVGCGNIAAIHLQALAELPQILLVALVDPRPQAADDLVRQWQALQPSGLVRSGLPACYASLADLIADPAVTVDVVHICTPHHTHVSLAVAALRQGWHVLLEKPVAISEVQLAELAEAVSLAPGQFGVCLQNRYNRASQQARRLLASGLPGPVQAARGIVTWWRDAAYYGQSDWRGRWATEGGGLMINQAIHTLDLMLWLVGQPQSIAGQVNNFHLESVIEVEDTANAHILFENGATGVFYASNAYPASARILLDIACANMILRIEQDDLLLLDPGGEPLDPARWPDLAQPGQDPAGEIDATLTRLPAGKSYWGQGHRLLIQDFYDHLQRGETFPTGLAAGSLALQAVLKLYTASRSAERQFFQAGHQLGRAQSMID